MRFAGSQLSNFIDPTNFDEISKTSMKGRATERMSVAKANGLVEQADIYGDATIQSAKYGASATRAQGAASGQASMFGGIADGIGSLGVGLANRGGSGGGGTGNKVYGLGGGAGQGELIAPLSTGDNATSLLDSFLNR